MTTYAITEKQLQRLFGQMPSQKKEDWGYQLLQSLPKLPSQTQITADDVTDEMVEHFNSQFTNGAGADNESMLVAAVNAWLKHRSEAK